MENFEISTRCLENTYSASELHTLILFEGKTGLEPVTLGLTMLCSDHYSYSPKFEGALRLFLFSPSDRHYLLHLAYHLSQA